MAFDLGRVQQDIRELREFLKRAPKHPTPEEIHALRTCVRRLEASLQALAVDSMPNERRLLQRLAKLRRRAGKVRDLDVLTGYVAEARMKEEEVCRVQLLEYLGAEHARNCRRLHAFAVKHSEPLRHWLKDTAAYLGTLPADNARGSAAPGNAMLSELRLQRELATPARLNAENLHPYRLNVKELRYILQMRNDAGDQKLIETLVTMKDAIGEWHDWQELLTIAREQLPHGPKCKLLRSFQATTHEKLKHALTVANAGRKHIRRSFSAMAKRA
ncbi:MAG: CHAD domain-containing protein [Acidobacteriaceae bacterium]